MIHFFSTIADLNKFTKNFPDTTIVGVRQEENKSTFIDLDFSQIEVVYVDENGKVVGDEAGDYQPKENEFRALMIS